MQGLEYGCFPMRELEPSSSDTEPHAVAECFRGEKPIQGGARYPAPTGQQSICCEPRFDLISYVCRTALTGSIDEVRLHPVVPGALTDTRLAARMATKQNVLDPIPVYLHLTLDFVWKHAFPISPKILKMPL
jgi:hypothetical protein